MKRAEHSKVGEKRRTEKVIYQYSPTVSTTRPYPVGLSPGSRLPSHASFLFIDLIGTHGGGGGGGGVERVLLVR